ncbi:MAG: helix-turn-helix domain-containing protein [bacterium]|nr:helix-turn-helix domain-containing protein [bacterium]
MKTTLTTTTDPREVEPVALDSHNAAKYVGVGRSTFLKLVKAGDAPAGIRISKGRVIWRRSDLDQWLRDL